jgi:hypothetical protein
LKPMVRCKACGYIMPAGKLGDHCPACGAPKTVFEPYTNPIGEKRLRILNLDLHPIAVHFPVAFTYALLALLVLSIFMTGVEQALFIGAIKVITLFLPLLVIAAFVLGWIDGVTRFRKIRNSRILKTKILYGSLLFVFSVALMLVNWVVPATVFTATLISIFLAIGAAIFALLQGLLGSSIMNAAFPGN